MDRNEMNQYDTLMPNQYHNCQSNNSIDWARLINNIPR
jgi:hypothetical protein